MDDMSATMEKVSHVENNIFDHNIATNCDIETNTSKDIYSLIVI